MHCNVRTQRQVTMDNGVSNFQTTRNSLALYYSGIRLLWSPTANRALLPFSFIWGRHVGIRPFSHGHKQFGMKSPVQTRPKNAWNACFAWRHSMDSQDHTPKGSHTEATQRNVKQYEEMFHGSSYERNQWGSECNR